MLARSADASYATWGLYDVAFAAPEVISAALSVPQVPDPENQASSTDEGVSAAADLWSLGMLLFWAASGGSYWPRTYSQLDIVKGLLGYVPLPHELNPNMLEAVGALASPVSRLLSRSPKARPSALELGEIAAHGVCEAVMGLSASDVPLLPLQLTLQTCSYAQSLQLPK
jgi:serine/threonine protein kinase